MSRRQEPDFDLNPWYLLTGSTLLGLGIGMALNSAGAGIVIGLGAGFLAMVIHGMTLGR